MHIFLLGLQEGPFAEELARRDITEIEAVRRLAQEFMRVEEFKNSRAQDTPYKEIGKNKYNTPKEDDGQLRKTYGEGPRRSPKHSRPLLHREVMLTEHATAAATETKPPPQDQGRYCQYHKAVGHTTEECRAVKKRTEELIRNGAPPKFQSNQKDDRCREPERPYRRDRSRSPEERSGRNSHRIDRWQGGRHGRGEYRRGQSPRNGGGRSPRDETHKRRTNDNRAYRGQEHPEGEKQSHHIDSAPMIRNGVINMISGGFAGGGVTSNGRKRYLKQCFAM